MLRSNVERRLCWLVLSPLAALAACGGYIPSALVDWQRGDKLLQFEVGGELGNLEAFLQLANGRFAQTQSTTHCYVSLSHRISFND